MTADAPDAAGGKLPYVDRPEINEIYADSLYNLFYDGRTVRLEFAVHRPETSEAGRPPARWAYPVCRLVLTLPGVVDMLNQLTQLERVLASEGKVAIRPEGRRLGEG